VASGVIRTTPRTPFPERLAAIYSGLQAILTDHRPEAVAVEEVFFAANARSALKLAHVRGVTLLAAAERGLPVGEYSAAKIKGSVVGYGRATKSQVQSMVGSLLKVLDPLGSFDAADACAVAICHATYAALDQRLAGGRV